MGTAALGAPLARRARTGLYRGEDVGRRSAVTVWRALPGVIASEGVRAELAREAEVLASLGPHEAVLALHVDGSRGDPPELLLEGGGLQRLEDHVGAGPVDASRAVRIVSPVVDAAAHAHARSIVHGAISPGVVLVSDRGTPKLVGWADAIAPGLDPPEGSRELRDPAWLAPEVVLGEAPGPAADVYGLALLLVWLLAGEPGLAAAREASRGPGASSQPAAVLGALEGRAPAALARAIGRALARRPAERFEHAGQLREALERVVEAAPHLRGPRPDVTRGAPAARGGAALLPYAAVLAGLLAFAGVVELVAEPAAAPPSGPAQPADGALRILVHPWAEVSLDGELLDTTPIAAPVSVKPGRHVLDFVHPRAARAQRVVEVRAGQTVVVDVILELPTPAERDAGADSP